MTPPSDTNPEQSDTPAADAPHAPDASRVPNATRVPDVTRAADDTDFNAGDTLVVPPRVELVFLPAAFALCWMFASTTFGEILSFLPRLQFHELGHALVAWWTGRRALPLPIGFTAWSEERSWLLVGAQGLFTALLAVYGVRERRPGALAIAVALGLTLTVGVSATLTRSEGWVIAGGQIGETLLPAVVVAAFHLRLPQRLRWDFWRWLAVLVALFALASAVRSGWLIAAGERPLPWGALLGQESDGDLNRLVAEHGWTEPELRRLFGRLPTLALLIAFVPHAVVSGLRAWRDRAQHHDDT
jgi:hypothetical protein